MISKSIYYFLIILLILCSSLSQSETLTVSVPPNGYPPYIIVQGESISGILIDTLKAAAKSSYLSLNFILLPEVRSKALLNNHEIDVRMESPDWVSNPNDYLWSEPITSIKDIFVFNKITPNVFEKNETMKGAEINTHLGYSYPTLEKMFEDKKIKRKNFTSEKGMLLNLIRNPDMVLRAAVMDYHVAKFLISRMPKLASDLTFSRRHVDYKYIHFQFAKKPKMRYIVTKLNLEIKKLKQSGMIDKIIKRNLSDI